MTIGVLREPSFENRVSLLPEAVAALTKKGVQVWVEKGAGDRASSTDQDYLQAGARIVEQSGSQLADVYLAMHPPQHPAPGIWVGVYQPLYQPALIQSWAAKNLTTFSLDMLPRTTRAQSMDVLSSQANIAGYRAVLLAAVTYSRYFPMFMTAAGSITPAKVLILGAGVAGLQAIATAKRLGAVVEVFDTRPAVKEEVNSLGAKFIEVEGAADTSRAAGYAVEQSQDYQQRQQQKIKESLAKSDIVITTAQIPGKPAPKLIDEDMIKGMRRGSVIVDLASSSGGNTTLTQDAQTVLAHGVQIIGNSLLAAGMPADASKLYGKNVLNFLQLLINKEGVLSLNWADDLVKGCCITFEGAVVHERVKALIGG